MNRLPWSFPTLFLHCCLGVATSNSLVKRTLLFLRCESFLFRTRVLKMPVQGAKPRRTGSEREQSAVGQLWISEQGVWFVCCLFYIVQYVLLYTLRLLGIFLLKIPPVFFSWLRAAALHHKLFVPLIKPAFSQAISRHAGTTQTAVSSHSSTGLWPYK